MQFTVKEIGCNDAVYYSAFKMDSKGGNPFLMEDYPAEVPAQTSNPFLQDFEAAPAASNGENPFLNFTAESDYQPPTNSTNPFAFFEAAHDDQQQQYIPAADAEAFAPVETNFFATDAAETNLFGDEELVSSVPVEEAKISSPPQPPAPAEKPLPKRPPPPARPQPPAPPRYTKDLILSVTGAMDATSNHLLDRLQATRTPSPTLMHSPSPTPEHSFADLLDVDSNIPDLLPDDRPSEPTPQSQNILDLFDAPSSGDIFSADVAPPTTTENPFEEADGTETAFTDVPKDSMMNKIWLRIENLPLFVSLVLMNLSSSLSELIWS